MAKNEQKKQKSGLFFSSEMTGMLLALFSAMGLLCLITGESVFFTVGSAVQKFILGIFGFSAYPVFAFFLFLGIKLVIGFKIKNGGVKLAIGMFFVYLLLVGLIIQTATTQSKISSDFGGYISYCYYDAASWHTFGGILFGTLAYPLCLLLKPFGTYVLCSSAIILITVLVFKKRFKLFLQNSAERRERKADEKAERELEKKAKEFETAQARAVARGIENQNTRYVAATNQRASATSRRQDYNRGYLGNAGSGEQMRFDGERLRSGENAGFENSGESASALNSGEGYPQELNELKSSYESGGLSAIYGEQKFNLKTKKEMLADDDRQSSLKLLFGEKKVGASSARSAADYSQASLYGERRDKNSVASGGTSAPEREEVRSVNSYQKDYGDDLASKIDYIRRPVAPDYREPVRSPMGEDVPESVALRNAERFGDIDQSAPDRDVYVIGGNKQREGISSFDAHAGRTRGFGDGSASSRSADGFKVNLSEGDGYSSENVGVRDLGYGESSSARTRGFNYEEVDYSSRESARGDINAEQNLDGDLRDASERSSVRGLNGITRESSRFGTENTAATTDYSANRSSDFADLTTRRNAAEDRGFSQTDDIAEQAEQPDLQNSQNTQTARRFEYDRGEQLGMSAISETRSAGTSKNLSDERKLENPIDCIPLNYKYRFAPYNLMRDYRPDAAAVAATKREQENRKGIILQVLANAGISAQIVDIKYGPAITRFELTIPLEVSVKKITELQKDFNFRIAAPGTIRIVAPIPGTSRVGIEVPNTAPATVGLKDLVTDASFKNAKKTSLTFCLGKDLVGNPVNLDLSKMPHLLVAGATGTGKSVFLNTLLVSLMYKYTPEELRIVLVDPKIVEFSLFKGVPNLLFDEIITETPKACAMLDWACKEMDDRYRLLNENLVKNVDEYNAFMEKKGGKPLYKILIIIDEFADLMATSVDKKNIENKISRIAAKARAAGIHLIMATQRPSVDIIDGSIKTNFTSRVAFKMSSQMDAQVIMGEAGAEKLLGRGDVLYRTSTMMSTERAQGAFIDTPEIDEVCKYLREHNKCYYNDFALEEINKASEKSEASDSANATDVLGGESGEGGNNNSKSNEEIVKSAMRLAISTQNISISLMQRRLGLGYPRAGKIMDILTERKYVCDSPNSRGREIKMTKQEFEQIFGEPFDNTGAAGGSN